MRLRTAAHGTLGAPQLGSMVGRKGGVGKQVDAVSRQLILKKVSLVERHLDNYEYDAVGWAPKEYNPDDKQSNGKQDQSVDLKDASAPQAGFVWDEASGYYYDASSGFYYD